MKEAFVGKSDCFRGRMVRKTSSGKVVGSRVLDTGIWFTEIFVYFGTLKFLEIFLQADS